MEKWIVMEIFDNGLIEVKGVTHSYEKAEILLDTYKKIFAIPKKHESKFQILTVHEYVEFFKESYKK